ncbi:MAG: hypothetical protein PUD09_01195 [Coriobacteriales bacterium]|nr:hypothetical protein [Coriobacteriales bacterium]
MAHAAKQASRDAKKDLCGRGINIWPNRVRWWSPEDILNRKLDSVPKARRGPVDNQSERLPDRAYPQSCAIPHGGTYSQDRALPQGCVVSVAFVCTHNACRSQMAEAMARQLLPACVEVHSAGTDPADEVDPGALAELTRRGVSTAGLRPKALAELPRIDWLVTMGCGVACPSLPCKHREDWGLTDPMGGAQYDYAACADAIVQHLEVLREQIAKHESAAFGNGALAALTELD